MQDQDKATEPEAPTAPPTMADLARRMAKVADVLQGYAHLPTMHAVTVRASGSVYANPRNFARGGQVDICEWAMAFGAQVELDLTQSMPYIRAAVTVEDIDMRLSSDLFFEDAKKMGEALGLPVRLGSRVTVNPAALLDVLAVTA